jgi:molybdopterin-guanine dinucleotide biosynthesis protein A
VREYSVFILTGGQSRRMGAPKAQLMLGGQSFLEWTLDLAQQLEKPVSVIGKSNQVGIVLSVPLIQDYFEIQTPLVGIFTALQASPHDWNYILACDYPLMDEQLVLYLQQKLESKFDAVIPQVNQIQHPLAGFYHRRIQHGLKVFIENGGLKVKDFLETLNVQYVALEQVFDLEKLTPAFMNINTPADRAEVQQLTGFLA